MPNEPPTRPPFSKDNPERKPRKEKKVSAPDDLAPPPWPEIGTTSQEEIYAAVGRALDRWERTDSSFSTLFSVMVAPRELLSREASYVYSAVRAFEGRLSLVQAAGEAYFPKTPKLDFEGDFWSVCGRAKQLCGFRNNIAHGVVDIFHPHRYWEMGPFAYIAEVGGFDEYAKSRTSVWMPSFISDKRPYQGRPLYCYTPKEIDRFAALFETMTEQVNKLMFKVNARSVALYGKAYRLSFEQLDLSVRAPSTTDNQDPPQSSPPSQ